jgi:Protein of unknown function (DUF2782)
MRTRIAASLAAFCCAFALTVFAQSAPPPPKLEPLPEPLSPPPEIANDPELEPQITIIHRENETIEEFRIQGRLTMIKVTPRHGRPYYLVADGVNGQFTLRDNLESGLKVPLWVLFTF